MPQNVRVLGLARTTMTSSDERGRTNTLDILGASTKRMGLSAITRSSAITDPAELERLYRKPLSYFED